MAPRVPVPAERHPRGRRLRAAAYGLFSSLLAVGAAAAPDTPRGVRIVLVTLDTLRADSFDGRGQGPSSMPSLRSFAKLGQRFERFYAAAPSTQPSHASLFTGLHPWQHGVTRNGVVLAEDRATLAERLREAGFGTGAVVASFPLDRRFGLAQGFDRYVAEFDVGVGFDRWEKQKLDASRFYSLADAVTERGIALLDAQGGPGGQSAGTRWRAGPKQFLWFHYYDPHDPYGDGEPSEMHLWELQRMAAAGKEGLMRRVRIAHANYERDVAALDRAVGRLIARLRLDLDAYETHFVIASDHGESFGEDGSLGHGVRLTPEQIRVPLVIVSSRFPSGVRSDVAGMVDLHATILALAGLEPPPGRGRDLALPPPPDAHAVGMSRSFEAPAKRFLTSGDAVEYANPRFFRADASGLVAGDARAVFRDDRADQPLDPAGSAAQRKLFAGFESLVEASKTSTLDDAQTREALRALGYVE